MKSLGGRIKYFTKSSLERTLTIFYRFVFKLSKAIHFDAAIFLVRRAKWSACLGSLGEETFIYPNVVIHNPNRVASEAGSQLLNLFTCGVGAVLRLATTP
ncbi:MAG: hypothetical protein IPQ16_09870 [Geobacteraceae bacterium]|nr:hypothetical protein [Geobacteraceae bacterium]